MIHAHLGESAEHSEAGTVGSQCPGTAATWQHGKSDSGDALPAPTPHDSPSLAGVPGGRTRWRPKMPTPGAVGAGITFFGFVAPIPTSSHAPRAKGRPSGAWMMIRIAAIAGSAIGRNALLLKPSNSASSTISLFA